MLEDYWLIKGIDYVEVLLLLLEIFGWSVFVVVEIGFGMGKLLVEMVVNVFEKDFIGIEVYCLGVGVCLVEVSE